MEKKLLIEGMMCAHCQMKVQKALSAIEGVTACTVDLAAGIATVTLNGDVADEALFAAVRGKGFTPVKML